MLKNIIFAIAFLIIIMFSYKAISNLRQSFEGGEENNISMKEIGRIINDVRGMKKKSEKDVMDYNEFDRE